MLDVDVGHPQFGKAQRCPTCGNDQQQQHLESICGLSPEMKRMTFSRFSRMGHIAAAWDVAQALALQPSRFLTLAGPNGRGKTTLLACIVNAGRQAGYTSVYASTADFLDHLRRAYAPDTNITYDGVFEKYTTCTILALDELDAFKASEWAEEKFRQLIDHRYRERSAKLTVFATNKAPQDFPGYLYSRMADRDNYLFDIAGPDLRRI